MQYRDSVQRTVIVRDRRWVAWVHCAERTTTSLHDLPGARLIVPLEGRVVLSTSLGRLESTRAVVLASHQRATASCEGRALTFFFDLRTPEARALPVTAWIVEPGLSERFRAAVLAGIDHLPTSAERLVSEVLPRLAKDCRPRPLDPRIEQATEWLEQERFEPASTGQLSRRVGLSASRLTHLFQRQLGVSARTLSLYYRTFGAVELVLRGQPIATASANAGFADQAHFARSIRRFFGKTASYVQNSRNVQDARR